ncbi:aspartic peptidase domain-containing protein [Epithele typhae]|uniref:aspartic peptidase domain-containing protein n=1 Tax=Epithele typhae TaxID=378194 RepID=UPI002007BF7C|nr:aspartic peptidase domain-containing protein [Epithele typhae]KAH9934496.1 aspartic peptidase domain-containing protein [Epithele typhae]
MRITSLVFSLFCAAVASSSAVPALIQDEVGSAYPITVSTGNDSVQEFAFTNAFAIHYTITMKVNGVAYQVLVDLGSSDTWINPVVQGNVTPPGLIYTGINATIDYLAGGNAPADIVLANVTLGPYTINNQAIGIVNETTVTCPGGYAGLIGLAGFYSSHRWVLLTRPSQLFKLVPELPNYVTFQLDTKSPYGSELGNGGVFTIGSVLSDAEEVLDSPVMESLLPGQWMSFLQRVEVNGRTLSGHSNITNDTALGKIVTVPEGNTVVLFDTGSALIQGPSWYVDEIYSGVEGANRTIIGGSDVAWEVPCDTKLNISWVFDGVTYPLHPVDSTHGLLSLDGEYLCIGSILGNDNLWTIDVDWLMGDRFMGSVYQVFDYGDIDVASGPIRGTTQLLGVVDPDQAWAETDALLADRRQKFLEAAKRPPSPCTQDPTPLSMVPTDTRPATWTGSTSPASVTTLADTAVSSFLATASELPTGSASVSVGTGTTPSSASTVSASSPSTIASATAHSISA